MAGAADRRLCHDVDAGEVARRNCAEAHVDDAGDTRADPRGGAASQACGPPEPIRWSVVFVRSDDALNARQAPSPGASIVEALAANAVGLTGTGEQRTVGTQTWVELVLGDGTKAWANRRAIASNPVA